MIRTPVTSDKESVELNVIKKEKEPKLKKDKGEPKIKKKGNKYKHDKNILSLNIHFMDRVEDVPILLTNPVVEVTKSFMYN